MDAKCTRMKPGTAERPGGRWQNSVGNGELRALVFRAQSIEVTDYIRRDCVRSNAGLAGGGFFSTNCGQLAGVEPIASAVWTLVHFYISFCAEEMALELYICTARARAFPRKIDDDFRVASYFHELLSGGLGFVIHLLKFEIVEPDSAAAILAGVDREGPDLKLGQLVETGGTFHLRSTFDPREGCVKPR